MGTPYVGSQTWERHTFFCDVCKKELPPGAAVFEPSGKFEHYCSMACARKALGIEQAPTCRYPSGAECPFMPDECSGCTYFTPQACANYEPEAEVFEWVRDRFSLQLKSTTRMRSILRHEAEFEIDEADKALLQAAPQTAANLAKAEAEIVRLTRFGRKVETQNADLRRSNRVIGRERNANQNTATALRAEIDALQNEVDLFTNGPLRAENDKLRAEIDANKEGFDKMLAQRFTSDEAGAMNAKLRDALTLMMCAFEDQTYTAAQELEAVAAAHAALGQEVK